MVVKIVKAGLILRRAFCDYCGCEFVFDDEWLSQFCNKEDKDRLRIPYKAIKCGIRIPCPFCNHDIFYNANEESIYVGHVDLDSEDYDEKK